MISEDEKEDDNEQSDANDVAITGYDSQHEEETCLNDGDGVYGRADEEDLGDPGIHVNG